LDRLVFIYLLFGGVRKLNENLNGYFRLKWLQTKTVEALSLIHPAPWITAQSAVMGTTNSPESRACG
jgi:hypothetical protein